MARFHRAKRGRSAEVGRRIAGSLIVAWALAFESAPPANAGFCDSNSCDDGIFCTIDSCHEATDTCSHTPSDARCPDDGNPCSDQVCNPTTGCAFVCDNTNSCGDGLYCNGTETCLNCACTDGPDPCPPDAFACTNDFCDEVADICKCVEDHAPCQNGVFCDGTEHCLRNIGCVDAPDRCASPLTCNEASDVCEGCTNDAQCQDGLYCNGVEFCDLTAGRCVDGPDPCPVDGLDCTIDTCLEENLSDNLGKCKWIPDPRRCDDGVPCTNDLCDPATSPPSTGCTYTCNSYPCDDGNLCTINDRCSGKFPPCKCEGVVRDCSYLNDPCNIGRCESATGNCVAVPVPENQPCEDGLFCNGAETCRAGICVAGEDACDDGVPCTLDTCDEAEDRCEHDCPTPGITCPPARTFECDAVGEFGDPILDDTCSPNPTAVCIEESTPGKLPQEENILRTCTITNDCGNSAECTQQVEIVDTTPPRVECPPDLEFECDGVGEFGEPTVSDNCNPQPQVTVETETVVNDCTERQTAGVTPPPKLTVTRTVTAIDGAGLAAATGGGPNTAECIQRIDIFDTTPPIVVDCPESVGGCPDVPLEFNPPTCTDACGTCQVTCERADGLPLSAPAGVPTVITCQADDECANVSDLCETLVTIGQDCRTEIPTVSQWGLVILTLLLLIGAKAYFGAAARLTLDRRNP